MGHRVKDLFQSRNLGPFLQIVHINMEISVYRKIYKKTDSEIFFLMAILRKMYRIQLSC